MDRARAPFEFGPTAKDGLYGAIYGRRDVRAHFLPDPIPVPVLARLLDAAHHAPSVGFMQPWNFIVIHDLAVRSRVKALFEEERARSAAQVDAARRATYRSLKLEGILESALNLCVTCDPTRNGPFVIGRSSIPETDIYSTCCAVENLWLAARAEGIGMCWVSSLQNGPLKELLGIPPHVVPVAYLCLGYVKEFPERPDLERAGWLARMRLAELVYVDRWEAPPGPLWEDLKTELERLAREPRKET